MKIGADIKLLVLLIVCSCACRNKNNSNLFEAVDSQTSKIKFSNLLTPNDSINILDYNYFYNGGGIAAADFNNDGLTDLYFTGNQVSSRLYLNKGNFSFVDVTEQAGVGTRNWATGIATADVNDDGLMDMYVSFAGYKDPAKRVHQLFINKGLTQDGIPHFKDEAAAYRLADTSYTTQSVFFDFDRDGDLDLLLANHFQDMTNPNFPREKIRDGNSSSNMRLYRNDGPHFSEVSKSAGLLEEGYSLSACVSDINDDGLPDVYVAKDFVFDDALYINNGNGTFTESIAQYLAHTSQFSMGSDIADYNNDGFVDIVTVDMLPNDNKRQKLMNIAMNNDRFNTILSLGYMPQYSRNMLQLNNGPDAEGKVSFSEIGQLAGVYKTDWSWSPLFADLDNDGWKDLYITNGIPRDITNNDFITYRAEKIMNSANPNVAELKIDMLQQIEALEPVNKTNFVFQNNRDLRFVDQSETWGLAQKGFSNGAVCADLDNDGDLEIVTNNINAEASIFRNRSNEISGNNFLRIKLSGPFAAGAKVYINSGGKKQFLENASSRGFQSSQEPVLHFGLGKSTVIDSMKVIWLDGKEQNLENLKANQVLTLYYKDAKKQHQQIRPTPAAGSVVFNNITGASGIDFLHYQKPFEDFNHEPLLPHRFSANGPYMAAGDVDNNGFEDLWIGGPARVPGTLLLQQSNGSFISRSMPDSGYEDMGGVFFDADGDADLDLFVVSGGNAYNALTAPYQDRLYKNDGNGVFERAEQAIPPVYASGSVAAASDFDKDGDLDLFVGGR
ncbi:MAG TPA: VCBS repeat-containing protein, partial [Chitinophagaceae bacterium]|nr:VCBS repeat-containing protein [Chitinophagaceae bacterium]